MSKQKGQKVDTSDLSDEQLQDIKEAFKLFDMNGDGSIDRNELGTVLRSLGQNPTDSEVQNMLTQVDKDDSNSIDFNEFIAFVKQRNSYEDSQEALIDAFKVFDKDGNGYISAVELRTVLTTLGEVLTEEDVNEMMKEADKNGDGQISYIEFAEMMTK